jgi:hypothetical protein
VMDEGVKQGWLMKKGGGKRRANWKRRFFILRRNRIDYYEDNIRLNLKGTVPIDGHLATFNVVPFSEKKHAFVIALPNRDFIIQAASDAEMNRFRFPLYPSSFSGAVSFSPLFRLRLLFFFPSDTLFVSVGYMIYWKSIWLERSTVRKRRRRRGSRRRARTGSRRC